MQTTTEFKPSSYGTLAPAPSPKEPPPGTTHPPTIELVQVVLHGCACQHHAPVAVEGQQCVNGLVAALGLEPMPLITHQQVAAACKLGAILAHRLGRRTRNSTAIVLTRTASVCHK